MNNAYKNPFPEYDKPQLHMPDEHIKCEQRGQQSKNIELLNRI